MGWTESKISDFSSWPPVIVKQKRSSVNGVFGFLVVIFTLAGVRGYFGAETTGGRVAATVFMGILALGSVATWSLLHRRPGQIEVTPEAILLTHRRGVRAEHLTRGPSGEIFIGMTGGKHPQPYLSTPESEHRMLIWMFDQSEIRKAVDSAGWRFVGRG